MSKAEIFHCEQNSPEWDLLRCGIPTASKFGCVMREKGKAADGSSKERASYVLTVAGEIITGMPAEGYSNHHMERGHAMEDEARLAYAFMSDVSPQKVGFIKRGRAGGSPDSLIGDNGLLEIKTELPRLLIDTLLRNDFPTKHAAQCQGNLWLSGREFIDIAIYWPKMPLFIKRAYRQESFIRQIAAAVEQFNQEVDATVERVRAYRDDRPTRTVKEQFQASLERP